MFTSGHNIQIYLTVPERTRKRSWQCVASYDTPCLQGQWLSSNVGPRFTCVDHEGDDNVVDVEGGGGLGYESKWWMWLWVWNPEINF